jgi:hypothetical protein
VPKGAPIFRKEGSSAAVDDGILTDEALATSLPDVFDAGPGGHTTRSPTSSRTSTRELIRSGAKVDLELLRDPDTPLEELVSEEAGRR